MSIPFSIVWNNIQKHLIEEQSVQYWGKARGYSGKTFQIVKVDDNYILCEPPGANLQAIPKKDFEKMWSLWPDYLLGKVKRYQLRDLTRFSSYIISIFKHFE